MYFRLQDPIELNKDSNFSAINFFDIYKGNFEGRQYNLPPLESRTLFDEDYNVIFKLKDGRFWFSVNDPKYNTKTDFELHVLHDIPFLEFAKSLFVRPSEEPKLRKLIGQVARKLESLKTPIIFLVAGTFLNYFIGFMSRLQTFCFVLFCIVYVILVIFEKV